LSDTPRKLRLCCVGMETGSVLAAYVQLIAVTGMKAGSNVTIELLQPTIDWTRTDRNGHGTITQLTRSLD